MTFRLDELQDELERATDANEQAEIRSGTRIYELEDRCAELEESLEDCTRCLIYAILRARP